MLLTVLFVLAFLLASLAVANQASTGSGYALSCTVPFGAVLVLVLDALFAGIVSKLFAYVLGALGVALFNLFLAAAVIAWAYWRRKGEYDRPLDVSEPPQPFSAKKHLFGYVVLGACVVVCGYLQFGPEFQINFSSTDGAAHMGAAVEIASGSGLTGMYLTHYIVALCIELLSPFVVGLETYKAFLLAELVFLFLSGSMLYSLLLILSRAKTSWVLAIAVSVLCLLGYPLNNMVFGFSYLGVGVTIALAFAFGLQLRVGKPLRFLSPILIILLLGELITYSIFVPILVLSFVLSFSVRHWDWIKGHVSLSAVVLACLILVVFGGIELVIGSGLADGLRADGYIFTDFLGSLLLPLPLALYGAYLMGALALGEGHEYSEVFAFGISVVIGTVLAFYLFLRGVFSAYYLYKFYYLLWSCLFCFAFFGAADLQQNHRIVFWAYHIPYAVILLLAATGVESRLLAAHSTLGSAPISDALCRIYKFNQSEMLSSKIADEEVRLWEEADSLRVSEDDYVPLLGSNIDVYWYECLAGQEWETDWRYFYYWLYDDEQEGELVSRLNEVRYCAVLNGEALPDGVIEYLQLGKRVFENNAGYIVELPHSFDVE